MSYVPISHRLGAPTRTVPRIGNRKLDYALIYATYYEIQCVKEVAKRFGVSRQRIRDALDGRREQNRRYRARMEKNYVKRKVQLAVNYNNWRVKNKPPKGKERRCLAECYLHLVSDAAKIKAKIRTSIKHSKKRIKNEPER